MVNVMFSDGIATISRRCGFMVAVILQSGKTIKSMQVKNKNNGDRGTFYMEDGDNQIGIMHYTIRSSTEMVIDHTEVEEEYEGR